MQCNRPLQYGQPILWDSWEELEITDLLNTVPLNWLSKHASSRLIGIYFSLNESIVAVSLYLRTNSEAELMSTPTKETHSVITESREAWRMRSGISCWYIPTPMCIGWTLMYSSNGSCNLLASDTDEVRAITRWVSFHIFKVTTQDYYHINLKILYYYYWHFKENRVIQTEDVLTWATTNSSTSGSYIPCGCTILPPSL